MSPSPFAPRRTGRSCPMYLGSTAAAGTVHPYLRQGRAPDSAQTPPKGSGYAVALKWTALTRGPFDTFDMMNTAEVG